MIGSYMIADSIHNMANKIDNIPSILNTFSEKTAVSSFDAIKHALGSSANGLSKEQQFDKLSNQITTLQSNQQAFQNHINQLTGPLQEAHPQAAKDYEANINKKLQFVFMSLPRNPNPPTAFLSSYTKWKPSSQELSDFNKSLMIVSNPMHLLTEAKQGTITAKHVNIAEELNPATLNQMRSKIMEEAYNGKTNLSYQQRMNLSVIMGVPLDRSQTQTQQLQAVYAAPQQAAAPIPKKRGGSHLNPSKLPQAQPTASQRIAAK